MARARVSCVSVGPRVSGCRAEIEYFKLSCFRKGVYFLEHGIDVAANVLRPSVRTLFPNRVNRIDDNNDETLRMAWVLFQCFFASDVRTVLAAYQTEELKKYL